MAASRRTPQLHPVAINTSLPRGPSTRHRTLPTLGARRVVQIPAYIRKRTGHARPASSGSHCSTPPAKPCSGATRPPSGNGGAALEMGTTPYGARRRRRENAGRSKYGGGQAASRGAFFRRARRAPCEGNAGRGGRRALRHKRRGSSELCSCTYTPWAGGSGQKQPERAGRAPRGARGPGRAADTVSG